MNNKEEIAYLAGFFDGEGCFTFKSSNYITKTGSKNFTAQAVITNTDYSLLNFLQKILERNGICVNIYRHWKNKPKPNWKDQFAIHVARQDDLWAFCKMIRPYLRGKYKQCDLILSFLKGRIAKRNKVGNKLRVLTLGELDIRQQIMCLNRRGV